jgi:hypothetical protein
MRDGFAVTDFSDSGQQYSGYAYRDAVATAHADQMDATGIPGQTVERLLRPCHIRDGHSIIIALRTLEPHDF